MRKILLFAAFILAVCIIQAQAPNQLNFQGVARNAQGNALVNQVITLRLSIQTAAIGGVVEYTETRSITTNAVGLFSVVIGSAGATSSNGTIAAINWNIGTRFLLLEIDVLGGNNFVSMGTTQLQSVPYALNARTSATATNVTGVVSIVNGGTGSSVQNFVDLSTDQSIGGNKVFTGVITGATIRRQGGTALQYLMADGSVGTGATGPTGAAGVAGAQGIKGDKGDIGVTGANGPTGPQGIQGLTGANGAAGVAGTQGLIGLTGTNGTNGTNGAAGVAGAQGLKGDKGDNGASGANGAQGLIGLTGTNGTNGTVGVAGAEGLKGDKGDIGVTGAAGTQGSPGAAGAVGAAGINGTNGSNASITLGAMGIATPNGATITNGILSLSPANAINAGIITSGAQNIAGVKTFIAPIVGSVTGNAATVTTNANLTGDITSTGNVTTIGNGKVTDAMLVSSFATTTALALKEDLTNKSASTALGTSDVLYPTQNAVKTYVDAQVITTGATPDATASITGKIQLTGDLGGTAASPLIANNAITTVKIADANVTDAKIVSVSGSKVTGNIAGNAATATSAITVTTNANLTGDVTSSGNTTSIAAASLGYGKIQNVAAQRLLGNKLTTSGSVGEISIGTGLVLDASTGTLSTSDSGGTVTTVSALTLSATGTDITSTVANNTTTPVITLNIPSASSASRGLLTFADWTTFNNKQAAITLTTTGSSGASTLTGGILNIPQYAGATYTAGTGLTLTTGAFNVNASQNISTLSNLATLGLVHSTAAGLLTSSLLVDADITPATISNAKLANTAVANLSGINTGDQTITLTGDVSGIGIGSFVSTLLATSGVTPGNYGSATSVPTITVDSKGRITSATSTSISGVSPVGSSLSSGNILVGSASNLAVNLAVSGDVTIGNTGVTAIGATKVTNAMLAGSIDLASKVTGTLPVANGGTGASSQNFVDLTNNQTVAGNKTFTGTLIVGGTSFPSTTGSIGQVLTLSSSAVASWAASSAGTIVRDVTDETGVASFGVATAGQISFTLSQVPNTNTKVKMFINGTRISNSAYSVNYTTRVLTYTPASNGSYAIVVSDRIQFDYFY